MSWRASFALLALFTLAGCGFHPLYAEPGREAAGSKIFAGVKVDPMPGRLGQQFRANLEDALNPGGVVPAAPGYRLSATIATTESPIGVARDATVSRFNVYIDSHYILTRLSDGKTLTTGDIRQVSSYNNLTNVYFSTYISQQDAIRQGMQALSEQYRQRLAAYLDSGAEPAPVRPPLPAAPPPPNPFPSTPLIPQDEGGRVARQP